MIGGNVGVTASGTTTSSFTYPVQYTLDDLMRVASSAVTWISDAAATALSGPSSTVFS
jgi:hypothetical protein